MENMGKNINFPLVSIAKDKVKAWFFFNKKVQITLFGSGADIYTEKHLDLRHMLFLS